VACPKIPIPNNMDLQEKSGQFEIPHPVLKENQASKKQN